MRRVLLWGAGLILLGGCFGESHTTDRPAVTDCTTATSMGQQRDPCTLADECGAVEGDRLRSAVCDNGMLLTARIETNEAVVGSTESCAGELVDGARVELSPSGSGCVDAVVCTEGAGGNEVRDMTLCQVGFTEIAGEGEPWTECAVAVREGVDGDPCSGGFACIADKTIGPAGVLPIVGWCDDGLLRLAPSQTLLLGPP